MCSSNQTHNNRLLAQLSTTEQSPYENLVLIAKCHMQHKWFRPNMREQAVVRKDKIKLNANVAAEDGKDFDALCVGR